MGLSPKLWGREGWRFIHFVAVTYQPSKKEEYLKFFQNLPEILPCPVCGEHFKQNMAELPPRMESNQTLFEWSVDMHNLVNKETGKRIWLNENTASMPGLLTVHQDTIWFSSGGVLAIDANTGKTLIDQYKASNGSWIFPVAHHPTNGTIFTSDATGFYCLNPKYMK